ncbi:MAG: hypothetical protein U2P59_00145 [Synergistota bacterium]|nr:hypothetical protein [Synergistota bacterium]
MKLFSGLDMHKDMTPAVKREVAILAAALLILLAGTFYSMKNFIWLNNISEETTIGELKAPVANQPPKSNVDIEGLEDKYDVYLRSRNFSGQLVMLAEAVGRYPIANASSLFAEKAVEEYELPEIPPVLTIKALVILDGVGVAALDIEGERPGQIVRKGYVFGGGKGKITSIDAGGVSWKWSNTQNRTNL